MLSTFQQILVANGFVTDIGGSANFGPPPEAAPWDKESLWVYPTSKRIVLENRRWMQETNWQVDVVKFTTTPEQAIALLESDLWKAIGTIDGPVFPLEDAVEYEIATQGKTAVRVTCRFKVESRTPLFAVSG